MTKRSHSPEALIEAARLFDEGFGYAAAARQLALSRYTLRDWHDQHKQGMLIGLGPMSHHKFSYEEKLAAVEILAAGATKTEVMQRLSIPSRAVLNKWFASYRLEGPEALAPKPKGRRPKDKTQVQETDAQRIIRLEMELAVLKKYNALLAAEDYAQRTKRKSSRH